MVTDLPKYMTDVLKFNIAATGTLTAMPYLAMWICSFIFGWVCDVCVKRNWHSIKTGRIIHTTIGEFYFFTDPNLLKPNKSLLF
jgi:MFS transporter, ACS family, solute carrier family 17 (sodium-dependent inorganic phosphate cotransporter), other